VFWQLYECVNYRERANVIANSRVYKTDKKLLIERLLPEI